MAMHAFLLTLGIIAVVIGVTAIGFGVPNYAFDLGNTLFIAGSVWAVGGFALIGLAAAVRQLRRLADVAGRPIVRRQPALEGAEVAAHRPQAPRIPSPGKPGVEAPGREPRLAAAPADEGAPERPRSNIFGVARGGNEPAVAHEPDAVPLAPSRTPAPPVGRDAPLNESTESKADPSDLMTRLSNLAAPPRPPVRPEPPRTPADRPRANMFDAVWPSEARAARARAETIPRAPKLDTLPEGKPEGMLEARPEPRLAPEPRPQARVEPKLEPRVEPKLRPEPRVEPSRDRSEPGAEPRNGAPPVQSPAADEPHTVAILKSGVIDGMAYTLYTDGSIEAELPQGTMRFASIEELRAHLEKAERPE